MLIAEEFIPEMASRITITSLNEEWSALIKYQITGKLMGEEFVLQNVLRIIITSLNEEGSAVVKTNITEKPMRRVC